MRIEIRQGDIADQPDLDAVVNAANTELWMGSGVAGALKRRGGEEIEREAVRQAPIALGDAVRTGAGALPNRHVIHAAAMGYRPEDEAMPKRAGSRSSDDVIRRATRRSLALADESAEHRVSGARYGRRRVPDRSVRRRDDRGGARVRTSAPGHEGRARRLRAAQRRGSRDLQPRARALSGVSRRERPRARRASPPGA